VASARKVFQYPLIGLEKGAYTVLAIYKLYFLLVAISMLFKVNKKYFVLNRYAL